jgi:hypothetical protein
MTVVFDQIGAAYPHLGLRDIDGMAFMLVTRIADLLFLVFGTWLLMHYGLSRYMRPQEKAELKRRQTQAFVKDENGVSQTRDPKPDG